MMYFCQLGLQFGVIMMLSLGMCFEFTELFTKKWESSIELVILFRFGFGLFLLFMVFGLFLEEVWVGLLAVYLFFEYC